MAARAAGRDGQELHELESLFLSIPTGDLLHFVTCPSTSAELRADQVVMGTAARTDISGLIFGNALEAILEQLASSVLAVMPRGLKTSVKIES